MLILKINEKIVDKVEEYLRSEDFGFTRNGNEFEIPAADTVGFIFGRAYQTILNDYHNEGKISKEEEPAKDK